MTDEGLLAAGARNLLVNCADLDPDQSLLIVAEDPALGWYDRAVADAVAAEAEVMGITPTVLSVGAPENTRSTGISEAVAAHDCTVFLSRIGDQDRFEEAPPGRKTVMCYARDAAMLASAYGRTPHQACLDLKAAVNDVLFGSRRIDIRCPLGTDMTGTFSSQERESSSDVSIRRFPVGVPQPVGAASFAGRVALARYLTPTGSKVYDPAFLKLEHTVFATVEAGHISGFEGDADEVGRIEAHYANIADHFGIDPNVVHSWHAGIHPACSYTANAADNPDRWANTVFTNPRVLHFHTCGAYAPGEICWMVLDPTVTVDGIDLWEQGRLKPERFRQTTASLDRWPELVALFARPSGAIGLSR
jgi:hypothetical protein